ncbi:MAG: methyltransferase domain-containing protein [Thermoplasmata archaeon]
MRTREVSMGRRIDPEGSEIRATRRFVSLEGARVLDVGCGEGRLTARLATVAKEAFGLDPVEDDVVRGWSLTSPALRRRMTLGVGAGEDLPFHDGAFDVVFFSWSLCCMASVSNMKDALHEAWRVLRPEGYLVNLQPSLYQPFARGAITYLITGQRQDLVMDEGSALPSDARFALEHTTLYAGMFDLLGEEEFEIHTYYDTEEELLERLVQGREKAYAALPEDTRAEIQQRLTALRIPEGVLRSENAILTALRRSP